HAEPDVEADRDQHQAEQERDPPSPDEERAAGGGARQEERAVAEDQADRYADLGPAGDQAAPAPAAPLHGQQHRAAPLTAHADALQDPHERQQDAAPDPDGGVAGNDADRGGGQA